MGAYSSVEVQYAVLGRQAVAVQCPVVGKQFTAFGMQYAAVAVQCPVVGKQHEALRLHCSAVDMQYAFLRCNM